MDLFVGDYSWPRPHSHINIGHGQNEDASVCEEDYEIIDEWLGIPNHQLCRYHHLAVIHPGTL